LQVMDVSPSTGTQMETRIFVSYAREDAKWLNKDNPHSLIPFLMESLRRHNVTFWFDKNLKGGDVFEQHIAKQIDDSQVALLIVSQCFLNSEFIENKEMPRIAERARLGKMIVVPVLVEPCDWSDYSFLADRQMVPGPAPLIEYTESEAQWAKVRFQILDGLKTQVKRISAGLHPTHVQPMAKKNKIAAKPMSARSQVSHVQPATQKSKKIVSPAVAAKKRSQAEPSPRPRKGSEEAKRYHLAAEEGDATAQFKLGLLYSDGNGVSRSYSEAYRWYRKAANQGHADAQQHVGFSYYIGEGVKKNFTQAVLWFRKAAEQGMEDAQYYLGLSYYLGDGVKKDDIEAVLWFRRAAQQGHTDAQNQMGSCYALGNGVKKDYTEAVRWYRKAAEQGDASAQSSLGFYYHRGWGVKQDDTEAARWYRKAADQGWESARDSLKELGMS
jgi:TPR repeat protein